MFPVHGLGEYLNYLVNNCRVIMRSDSNGEEDNISFNDKPTAVALAMLYIFFPYSSTMLDTFLETGGITAALQVLRQSNCPTALGYIPGLIGKLLPHSRPRQDPASSRREPLADECYRSGGWSNAASCTLEQFLLFSLLPGDSHPHFPLWLSGHADSG
jgi:hypothetical protein